MDTTSSHNHKRCAWVPKNNPLYQHYHDEEWGVPVHDDIQHFEFISLEGAQAGLSWESILKRRKTYRAAFDDFDPHQIIKYDEKKMNSLLSNPGIIRNKLKVKSTITNAFYFLKIQSEFGSFDKYIWNFVDGEPIINQWQSSKEMPAETEISRKISKDLKKRGFSFVGPVIIYAYMQAAGLVNDHTTDCFRYREIQRKGVVA